jgi:hypothetical protein
MKGVDEPEWEIEIAFYINDRDVDPEKARIFTILRWMHHGDFRPLAAAIWDGHKLDEVLLKSLAEMISEDRLKLVPRRGRGRPKAPGTTARKIVVGRAYEAAKNPSNEVFETIAKTIGTSVQTVRKDLTAWRKAQREIARK